MTSLGYRVLMDNSNYRRRGIILTAEGVPIGRRGALPGVVVRGSVRVMAAVTSTKQVFSVEDLRPRNYQRWRELRQQLQQREETRRQQWRFRKNPAAYLAEVEVRLLQ